MQCISIQGGTVQPLPTCSPGDLVILTLEEAKGQDLESLGITAETVTQVMGWGFAIVLLFWSIGYGIGIAKKVISKA